MSPFIPIIDNEEPGLLAALSRVAPFIINSVDQPRLASICSRYIEILPQDATSIEQVTSALDRGADVAVVTHTLAKDVVGHLPPTRLHLLLDANDVSAISDKIRTGVSGVLVKSKQIDTNFLASVANFFKGSGIYIWSTSPPQLSDIRQLRELGATSVIPSSTFTLGVTSNSHLNVVDAFMAPLKSDRPDNLFPTVVTSFEHGGRSLGLVYSSEESIAESILSGKGVYQSRKRGLWRKGETSGALQEVVHITQDCDSDSLEFQVKQHGTGFCHTGAFSCFGELSGLAALESTLRSRLHTAPEGSYTRRLFSDSDLLHSKILEEADELCRAQNAEEIAFEAADLIFFALTKCISKGVILKDVEDSLDRKAKKVTRRPGNSKQAFRSRSSVITQAIEPPTEITIESSSITLRKFYLPNLSTQQRANLLKRPVLNSLEMIAKVEPIVMDVRQRGDKSLLELTYRFDKASLSEPILLPPFSEEAMALPTDIRVAIDCAYDNIKKFHEAQLEQPLKVETMPGVVCSRFARAISRVGLYVPGGTAVLPSTALMLGVPAQVAGCKEIVIATPPRPDGSISPEVMYAACKIGATAILKAGGAQAIAALAYGTDSVPKVDKIFGPGNQWVTAAKMLVQNDTDALVAIDMPAGPSEVIADASANPAFVAADLLSQAEHGVDSQVVLVAIDLPDNLMKAIEEQIDGQAKALPRFDILKESLRKSLIIQVPTKEAAIDFSNDYAPEHLILHLVEASIAVEQIQNAGSIFVGPWSPESCGDYASGTNHTLPTNGYARQFSGVNTLSFQKHITSQEVTRSGLELLGPVVATIADAEGLQAHANAVRIRLAEK